jgi:hypothetical protein
MHLFLIHSLICDITQKLFDLVDFHLPQSVILLALVVVWICDCEQSRSLSYPKLFIQLFFTFFYFSEQQFVFICLRQTFEEGCCSFSIRK